MGRAILETGLHFENTIISTATEPTKVQQFVEQVDTIIVSPGRKKHVKPYIRSNQHIIEFIFVPDAGSVNLLKTYIKNI